MRAPTIFTFATCLALATPAAARSQFRVDLIPSAGYSRPLEALGAVTLINQAYFIDLERHSASASFGISAEARSGGAHVGARFTGSGTLPGTADVTFQCRPGLACPSVLLESAADISTLSAIADIVFHAAPLAGVNPWLAAGGGLRRYDISWDAPAVLVDAGAHRETVPALHGAIGLDIRIGGGALRAELGGLWSPAGKDIPPVDPSLPALPAVPGRAAQKDLILNLGWRLYRF